MIYAIGLTLCALLVLGGIGGLAGVYETHWLMALLWLLIGVVNWFNMRMMMDNDKRLKRLMEDG